MLYRITAGCRPRVEGHAAGSADASSASSCRPSSSPPASNGAAEGVVLVVRVGRVGTGAVRVGVVVVRGGAVVVVRRGSVVVCDEVVPVGGSLVDPVVGGWAWVVAGAVVTCGPLVAGVAELPPPPQPLA